MVAVHSAANLILGQAKGVFHIRACHKIIFAALMLCQFRTLSNIEHPLHV